MTGKVKRTELDLCLKKYPTRERSLKKTSYQYRNQQQHPDETDETMQLKPAHAHDVHDNKKMKLTYFNSNYRNNIFSLDQ